MRPIHAIAADIQRSWKNIYFGAKPYLEAMFCLQTPSDSYGYESGRVIILYFLSNATTWKGDEARRIKAELKSML
jgi:hypothetical protein